MNAGNSLCGVCNNRAAEMFCPCATPETLLCGNCITAHTSTDFEKLTIWSINYLPYYKINGYSARLHTRQNNFPQVCEQVRQKVQLMDLAIQEFCDEMNKMIYELIQYLHKVVGELNERKAELFKETEEALAEVKRKLEEDRPQFSSNYGQVFWELTENLQPFELFTYSLKTFPPQPALLHTQLYPPLHIYLRDKFSAMYGKQLAICHLKTGQTTQHTLAADIGASGYLELDRNTVMVVGREVIIVDTNTCQISKLEPLLSPRICPGLGKVENTVFAFGGSIGSACKACEKWSILDKCWTRLRDMNYARAYFTPCHFNSLIYLAATLALDHRAVESFSPTTEICTVLPVSLPLQLTLGCNSVVFVAFGELCLLTKNKQMARWRVDSESEFRLSEVDRECWSTQQPLITGKEVLIAVFETVVKFSLETYSFL